MTVEAVETALEQFARVTAAEMRALPPAVRAAVRHAVKLERAALPCAQELVEELEGR